MVDDTPPHGGHGGAPVNHQLNDGGQRLNSTRLIRVGGSRRVRPLARNGRIRRGNTMAHAQAMAGGANGQLMANPPGGPGNPPAGPGNPPAGPGNPPAGPVNPNPPAGVQAGNGAIVNAGAPPAGVQAGNGAIVNAGAPPAGVQAGNGAIVNAGAPPAGVQAGNGAIVNAGAPPAGVQAGNGAIVNAGAPPAQAPAFQVFDIDAGLLGPPLRKSQVGPMFHCVAQPLPW